MKIKMLLGTYPIINLVMSKDKIIRDEVIKFQYTLTFGQDLLNPDLNLISIKDALKIMVNKINTANITKSKLYPKKIDGWLYNNGTYFNSGGIGILQ